jgi:hypothetical protein
MHTQTNAQNAPEAYKKGTIRIHLVQKVPLTSYDCLNLVLQQT